MSILLLKSLLSVFMLMLSCLAMFTMFEVFGRSEKRYNIDRLKRLHKANGVIYLLIFGFISYFCLKFIILSGSELTPRATFHAVFAVAIIVIFGLKITFIHFYRQFYGTVKTLGILIALITFGLSATSGGYYLLVSKFGTDKTFYGFMELRMKGRQRASLNPEKSKFIIKTDPESIEKGKKLYEKECSICHNPHSTEWYFGPGHKGILKNPLLPVSKRPATPENVINQLRNPYRDMPSFSYLSDEDVLNLIAYLNTL